MQVNKNTMQKTNIKKTQKTHLSESPWGEKDAKTI
jgi:hypothetical protein